jgi:hypothetical protein
MAVALDPDDTQREDISLFHNLTGVIDAPVDEL